MCIKLLCEKQDICNGYMSIDKYFMIIYLGET